MREWMCLALFVFAAGAVIGVAGILVGASRKVARAVRQWRARNPEELERLRRAELNRRGRIAPAQIVDLIENEASRRVVVYRYEVAGVTYEAAQDVAPFASAELVTQALAGPVSHVKYDPQAPLNSMIACEDWHGFDGSRRREA